MTRDSNDRRPGVRDDAIWRRDEVPALDDAQELLSCQSLEAHQARKDYIEGAILITQSKGDFGGAENDELYLEGRRVSRSKKSRDYAVDMGLAGTKSTKTVNDGLRKCEQILNMLTAHRSANPFLEPVDFIGLQLDDYPIIVKEPMDLSTVRKRLRNREYKSAGQFAADVRKIWQNSFLYNQKFSPIYNMTVEMSEYFERLNRELNDASSSAMDDELTSSLKREASNKPKEFSLKIGTKPSQPQKPVVEKPMTLEEKLALSQMIKSMRPLTSQTSSQSTMEESGTSSQAAIRCKTSLESLSSISRSSQSE